MIFVYFDPARSACSLQLSATAPANDDQEHPLFRQKLVTVHR